MRVEHDKRLFKIVSLLQAQAAKTEFSASQVRRQARVPLGQEVTDSTARRISVARTERHTANDRQLNL